MRDLLENYYCLKDRVKRNGRQGRKGFVFKKNFPALEAKTWFFMADIRFSIYVKLACKPGIRF
jgi:hypothetical protein